MNNIFEDIPDVLREELFTQLFQKEGVKIERIVSQGHSTSEGQWYNQKQDEWVILLQGQAILGYENNQQKTLSTGDMVFIPAHTKHRVDWTAPDIQTVWLAVHLNNKRRMW